MLPESLIQGSIPEMVRANVPLANLTSMRVGGAAEYLTAPRTCAELLESLAWARDHHLAITLIGAGSNLLISDQGLNGLVVCTRHLRGVEFEQETGEVTAAAGEPVARLAMQIASQGWTGFEWAVGIPGTVGGLVAMNAGAQGGCAADCVRMVQVVSLDGEIKQLFPQDLQFSYRTSALQDSEYLVTGATFKFQTGGNPKAIAADTEAKLKARHRTQPYHLPNCGSVFRNPMPQFAAKLIEDAGLKGYRIGNAQISELHANFIVNLGNAQAKDILALIKHIKSVIRERNGVVLETEVKVIGNF